MIGKRIPVLLAAFLFGIGSPVSSAPPVRETLDLDQVIYATPKDPAIMAELEKTHSLDAVIKVLQSHQIQFQRQHRQIDTALLPANIYAQIAALPPGEPFIAPGGDQTVTSVIVGHEPIPAAAAPNDAAHTS